MKRKSFAAAMEALALALNQTRERSSAGRRLLRNRRGGFHTPWDFVGFDSRTEPFQFGKRQFLAARRQLRVVTKQMLVSRLPNENTAAARSALQTAGEIDFTAKDCEILLLLLRAHHSDRSHAGINTAAQQ